jgi:ABC-type Zn2+ transport system substrate-binding protein/surface adhesin
MDYKHTRLRLVMTTKTTNMLCVGIAAIAFLLVTIPVLKGGIAYADSGDHDHGDHDHDRDHGDHDHGDHDNDDD